MYQVVYGFFYLLSLLPWRVMYFLSDCIYVLVYYVFGYRKNVVFSNLKIAFPEKTEGERKRIAKDFYHGFVDSFVETVKLISISEKELRKRSRKTWLNKVDNFLAGNSWDRTWSQMVRQIENNFSTETTSGTVKVSGKVSF